MAETISSFLSDMISPLSAASLSMNRSLFVRATMPNGSEAEEEANSGGSAR